MERIWTDRTIDAFFILLRSGLEEKDIEHPLILTEEEWEDILSVSAMQTVTGQVARGIAHLPAGNAVPDMILMKFMKKTGHIVRTSAIISEVRDKLVSAFRAGGLDPVIMKGPESASFYLRPELRESGDLDIFFPGDSFEKACDMVSSMGIIMDKAPDGSVRYLFEGIEIDQHQKYFDLHTERQLPEVPGPYATLLMLSSHILKHCMTAGVGLRQLCDMAMAYRSLEDSYDKTALAAMFERTGLESWNKLLASFLEKYLGCRSHPYSQDELPDPTVLMDIIMEGGNFGHHAAGRQKAEKGPLSARKKDTVARMLRRLPFSLKYGRKELFCYFAELVRGNL